VIASDSTFYLNLFNISARSWMNIASLAFLEIVLVLLIIRLCCEMAASRIEM
jgi:hypothetical protein